MRQLRLPRVKRARVLQRDRGFTLLELLVVMIIIGVMSAVSFQFVAGSMVAYGDAQQRFAIIEAIDPALNRMTNDIAQSLPYSVRITPDGRAIEFALVVEGGFYRLQAPAAPPPGLVFNPLQFNPNVMLAGAANSFTLLGVLKTVNQFRVITAGEFYADLLGPGTEGYAVSVGHFGDIDAAGRPLPGFNIYAPAVPVPVAPPQPAAAMHVVSPAGVILTDSGGAVPNAQVQLPANHVFPIQSTGRRLHVINGFVSYICAGNQLFRRQLGATTGRTLQQNTAQNATTRLLSSGISGCRFQQDRGSLFQAPTVSIELRVDHPNDAGELVLFRQVRVKAEP